MTPSRWQKLKVGDVLTTGTNVPHVVTCVEKRTDKTGKVRVVAVTLVRSVNATDHKQWRVMTKGERERL